jgi:hypothetical protein
LAAIDARSGAQTASAISKLKNPIKQRQLPIAPRENFAIQRVQIDRQPQKPRQFVIRFDYRKRHQRVHQRKTIQRKRAFEGYCDFPKKIYTPVFILQLARSGRGANAMKHLNRLTEPPVSIANKNLRSTTNQAPTAAVKFQASQKISEKCLNLDTCLGPSGRYNRDQSRQALAFRG